MIANDLPPTSREEAAVLAAASARRPSPGLDVGALLARSRRVAAYAAVMVGVALVSVWMSLPSRALMWRISHEAKRQGMVLGMDDLSLSPWGTATIEAFTWSFPPSRVDEMSNPMVIDEMEVDVAVLKLLLFDELEVELEGEMGEGTFSGVYVQEGESSSLHAVVEGLPLHLVPKLQQSLNAPLTGTFDFEIDLALAGNKFEKANGHVEIACTNCVVGDGETKLFIPGVSTGMLAEGVTTPPIVLGSLRGRIEVKDGVGVAEEFSTQSEDITVKISGGFELMDPVKSSRLNMIIKLYVSDALQEADDNIHLLINTASAKARMDPPEDGWLGFKLRGTLGRPKFMGIKSLTKEDRLRESREQRRERELQRKQQRAERQARKRELKGESGAGEEPTAIAGEPTGVPTIPREAGASGPAPEIVAESTPTSEAPVPAAEEEEVVEEEAQEEPPGEAEAEQPEEGDGEGEGEAEENAAPESGDKGTEGN